MLNRTPSLHFLKALQRSASVGSRTITIRAAEGAGELAKIALIDGRGCGRRLESKRAKAEKTLSEFLCDVAQSKYKIIRQDPREESGARQILTLGHTLGPVLETSMGLAHGVAVAQGLLLQDKKRTHKNEAMFIFLKDFGKPFCRAVKIQELLNEARSRGWIQ